VISTEINKEIESAIETARRRSVEAELVTVFYCHIDYYYLAKIIKRHVVNLQASDLARWEN